MALFLVGALALLGPYFISSDPSARADRGVWGGPVASASEEAPSFPAALKSEPRPRAGATASESGPLLHLALLDVGALAPLREGGTGLAGALITYQVRRGDTIGGIAAQFGVAPASIVALNPEVRARSLRIGQELSILTVSGFLYEPQPGETIESIAERFAVDLSQLRAMNQGTDLAALSGEALIIPGLPPAQIARAGSRSLPDLGDYFVMPTDGFNWGKLHKENAVDIAAACGTPIVVAADGLVVDESHDEWSHGYGRYLLVEHPNGTRTKYAHLESVAVGIGDYVKQGATIGTMGQTGEATGCHLHFEVSGAQNPFARGL